MGRQIRVLFKEFVCQKQEKWEAAIVDHYNHSDMPVKKKKPPEWIVTEAPCPFDRADFWELWIKLLESPKWKKKPLSAIQMACTRLKRFDVDFAAILVETAIEGNYQGVVFPDTAQRYEIYKIKRDGTTTHQHFTGNGANKAGTSQARTEAAKKF